MKKIYATQPFEVGSKRAKSRSIALVIPHEVVKQYGIGTSTVIILRTDNAKTITLQTIKADQNLMPDAEEDSLAPSKQQQTSEIH